MSFTERYVSTAGGGAHDGTTEADAWTWAEMITAAPAAGTRVNMISDAGYSIGTTTLPANGTIAAPIVIRGYDATIGDLDNLGRNADGTLNTTGMPDVTITGIWTPSPNCYLQNLDITGALSSALIGSSAADNWGLISCNVVNTQNNASARAIQGDNTVSFINSDFYCSGAAHASVVDADQSVFIDTCRIRGTSTSANLTIDFGMVRNSVFYGSSGAVGAACAVSSSTTHFQNNTFYGLDTAITTPNSVSSVIWVFYNNIADTCSKWIDNLYSATGNITVIEMNNLLHTVTTARTGVETITVGELTTDPSFVNAGAGNFRLNTGSPALATGLTPYMDIGAYQKEAAAGGGGSNRIFGGG